MTATAATPAALSDNDLVVVHNTGDEPLSLIVDTQRVVIKPGKTRIVPFVQAAGWFGHPRARNVGNNRARAQAYDMLRAFYGFHDGFDDPDVWSEKCPSFRVETQDGEHLPMILDDPDGLLPLPGALGEPSLPVDSAETTVLRAALADQQARVDRLERLLAARDVAESPGVDPDAAPPDSELPKPADDAPVEDTPRATRLKGG